MSWKKILALLVVLMAVTFSANAADESANAKLIKIETDTYGFEQSGAILDRISRLEKDFSGRNMVGNMNARIEAIYDLLYNNDAGPSILAKINALEWNTNHEVAAGGIDDRLSSLENQIIGQTTEGTFNERIRALAKASYGQEILPIAQVQVPANILIKVETLAPVSSKSMLEGDTIPVRVVEDVFVDGSLVFARGAIGEGVITKVIRAKNIFSNGKIETDFHTLKTIDGQSAQTFAGIEAQDAMNANEMARGLSLIGKTFSGKNKDIEQVFIRGKNIELPAGIELYVQIREPIVVYGVRSDGVGGISLEEMNAQPEPEPAPTSEPESTPPPSEPISEPESTPPPSEPTSEPEPLIEQIDPEPQTSPPPVDNTVEPRPDSGKTLDGHDGEIIEIIDED